LLVRTMAWPASPGAKVIVSATKLLAASRIACRRLPGPLSAVVLVLELTRNFDSLMAPTLVAVIEATIIARRLGAPSIYSARLRPDPDALSARSAGAAAINALDRVGVLPPEGDDEPKA